MEQRATPRDLLEVIAYFALKDKNSPLYNKLANEKARAIAADFIAKYGT